MTGMSEVVQFTSVNERVLQGGMCSIYVYVCVHFPAFVFFMCACVHV